MPSETPESSASPIKRVLAFLEKRRRHRVATKAKRRILPAILAGILALLFLTFGLSLRYLAPHTEGTKLSLDQVAALAADGRITTATVLAEDSRVQATYTEAAAPAPVVPAPAASGKPVPKPSAVPTPAPSVLTDVPSGSGKFWVALPDNGTITKDLINALQNSGASVTVDQQVAKKNVRIVSEFLLPILILATLFGLLFTAKGSGGGAIGEVVSFGAIADSETGGTGVTFNDVGGADEAVEELKEVRDYLRDPEKYKRLGAAPPKGVLLFGPPGTGKTLLAKAVAGEAGVPFFSVAGAEFVESLVGVGAARVRDLFRRVRAVAPAIVFIDELDAAGRKRGAGGGGGGSDEREQTLNQLLVEIDGFDASSGIVVMGATNRPDILDPALMRPGRFDRHITIDRPDAVGRERIIKIHAVGKPIAPEVDFAKIARKTPGFTGADLANVVNEATLLTIRRGKSVVHVPELDEAVQRVLDGPQRRGRVLTEEERRRAAYHEIGHVVVAAALGRTEDLHRVSVLARGRTIAAATFGDRDASLLTRTELRGQLVATLGGVAAEQLIFGEGSTGAEQDVEHATDLARDMVARYGMSDALGMVRYMAKGGEGFLGDETPLAELSPETRQAVEAEIRTLVEDAQVEATRILRAHRRELDDLTARLEEEETLEDTVLEEALAPLLRSVEAARNGSGTRARAAVSSNGRAKSTSARTSPSKNGAAKKRASVKS
ncbi:MAG: cell division protease FtsH [Frankiales bacterium]|nr:cell division protease FtsH [Frankiales bacterium]MDX6273661.1 cell division protease FtsH [Frankiales bacterium]